MAMIGIGLRATANADGKVADGAVQRADILRANAEGRDTWRGAAITLS
jgi:hypothetical protein